MEQLATAVKIAALSSNQLANLPTAMVSFLVKPALEVLLLASFVGLVGGPVALTVCAGILISIITSIASGVAGSVANDRLRGILTECLSRGSSLRLFWASRLVVPTCVAVGVAIIGLGALTVLGVIDIQLFTRALMLLIPVTVVGILVGILAGSLAAILKDPFLAADALVFTLPLLTGVVAPLSVYPPLLATLCRAIPGTGAVEILRGAPWVNVLPDLLAGALLAALGSVLIRAAMRAIRSGHRSESF